MALRVADSFVKKGTIIGQASPLDQFKGVTDTYRTLLLTEDGVVRTVVAKNVPAKQLANEVLAANLANHLQLPVPPAYIAITTKDWCANLFTRNLEGCGLVFASEDVKSPAIAQIIHSNSIRFVIDRLMSKKWLGDLYGFDSWIVNTDRHQGNMLIGPDDIWIIDHERCFTGTDWSISELRPDKGYVNRLKEWVTPHIDESVRNKLANDVDRLIERLKEADLNRICLNELTCSLLNDVDLLGLLKFLSERIYHVSQAASEALDVRRII
jgi:hypothetical protein